MSEIKISSVNKVSLVGKVVGNIGFEKDDNGREYFSLQIQTEKHIIVSSKPKMIATVHNVVIYNKIAVAAFKKHLKTGYFIQANGELANNNGKMFISVTDYGHDASFMYLPEVDAGDKKASGGFDFSKLKTPPLDNSQSEDLGGPSPVSNDEFTDDDIPF